MGVEHGPIIGNKKAPFHCESRRFYAMGGSNTSNAYSFPHSEPVCFPKLINGAAGDRHVSKCVPLGSPPQELPDSCPMNRTKTTSS